MLKFIHQGTVGHGVSEVSPSNSAVVHGVFVGAVSPVKDSQSNKGIKYFKGNFSDRAKCVRMVSFDASLWEQIAKAREGSRSIANHVKLSWCTWQVAGERGNILWQVDDMPTVAMLPMRSIEGHDG